MLQFEILFDLSTSDSLLQQLYISLLFDKLPLHVIDLVLAVPLGLLECAYFVVIYGLHVVESQVKCTLRILLSLLQTLVMKLLLVLQLQLVVLRKP
jgi:hypothetical protein